MAAILTLAAAALLGAPALRLIGQAIRNGQRPELWAGLFFAGAGVGIPLRLLGAATVASDPEHAALLNTAGHLLFASGACALFAFTRLVFRPQARGAAAACAIGIAMVVISTLGVLMTGVINDEQSGFVLWTNLARVSALGWAFAESSLYARMMQRRTALGLGDPVVADRFRLWSLWTAALALAPLLAASARVLGRAIGITADTPPDLHSHAATVLVLLRLAIVICAPLAVYGIVMSFFPPARYLERVRARATSTR